MQAIWKLVHKRPGINCPDTFLITTDFRAVFDVEIPIKIVRIDFVDELQLHEIADACPKGRARDRIGVTGNRLLWRRWLAQSFAHKDPYPNPATRVTRLWARQPTQLVYQIDRAFQDSVRRGKLGRHYEILARRI